MWVTSDIEAKREGSSGAGIDHYATHETGQCRGLNAWLAGYRMPSCAMFQAWLVNGIHPKDSAMSRSSLFALCSLALSGAVVSTAAAQDKYKDYDDAFSA